MKDGIVIKGMWLLMGSAMKASLPVLGVSNPRAFWKESKKIYRREMDKLDEYGPNDILKNNSKGYMPWISNVRQKGMETLVEFFFKKRHLIVADKKVNNIAVFIQML